jgi:uracil-DNA glycosylase
MRRARLLAILPNIERTLVLGQFAQAWRFAAQRQRSVAAAVTGWQEQWPTMLALPHPSRRNNRSLKCKPWFLDEVVPALRTRAADPFGSA